MTHSSLKGSDLIDFYPNRIFEDQGKIFLYNVQIAAMFEIDKPTAKLVQSKGKTYDELSYLNRTIWNKEEFKQLISEMTNMVLIKNDVNQRRLTEIETNVPLPVKNLGGLVLFVAQECNLKCTYCYGNEGQYNHRGIMNSDTAKKAIHFLFNHSRKCEEVSVVFFGGEPLLNFGLIKEVVNYSKELCSLHKNRVNFSMTTNGTLLTNEITDFLYANKFSITISIDGWQEAHDSNRFFEGGIGTYERVINQTEKLRKSIPISARATITSKNLDLVKTFYHLKELGFKKISMSHCAEMLKDEDYNILTESNLLLMNEFLKLINEGNYDMALSMNNVLKMLFRINSGGKRTYFCGAGINAMAVDIDGKLYQCHRFVGSPEYIVGNIFNGLHDKDFCNVMEETSTKNRLYCGECWAVNLCGGGCPNENYVIAKSTRTPIENFCRMNKKIIEAAIYLYMSLNDEQRLILFNRDQKLEEDLKN